MNLARRNADLRHLVHQAINGHHTDVISHTSNYATELILPSDQTKVKHIENWIREIWYPRCARYQYNHPAHCICKISYPTTKKIPVAFSTPPAKETQKTVYQTSLPIFLRGSFGAVLNNLYPPTFNLLSPLSINFPKPSHSFHRVRTNRGIYRGSLLCCYLLLPTW